MEYLQTFVVVMESGNIVKVTVMGEDSKHGQGLAIAAAKENLGGEIWDICQAPQEKKESFNLLRLVE
jgi:hypothetical protein